MLLRALSLAARFVPDGLGDRDPVVRMRARFVVLASLTVCVTSWVLSALFIGLGAAGAQAALPVVVFGSACAAFPLLVRAGWSIGVVAHLFIATAQVGLVASISADGGLADPGIMWLTMTPLIAAFAGGSRLAWRAAASAWTLVLTLFALTRMGVSFPEGAFSARPGADVIVVINAVGCTGFVALLASLYEGPMMRHFQLLSRRLARANAELRRELAEREAAQAAAERSQARAEAASAAKDALLANMSHEFRTPLTAILGFADLLADDLDDEQRAYLTSIGRGANRLMRTLDGVLELAWLESYAADLDVSTQDLAAIVDAALPAHRPLAVARGLTLDVDAPSGPDAVHASVDPVALQRVVELLTDNALRFTDAGGVVVMVSANAPEPDAPAFGEAVIEIVDTGAGMARPFLDVACDPFVQASSGDARTHEGAGVGLAVARRLTELMGGRLEIESRPEQGTTARVVFPRVASDSDPADGPEIGWVAGRHGGETGAETLRHRAVRSVLVRDAAAAR